MQQIHLADKTERGDTGVKRRKQDGSTIQGIPRKLVNWKNRMLLFSLPLIETLSPAPPPSDFSIAPPVATLLFRERYCIYL